MVGRRSLEAKIEVRILVPEQFKFKKMFKQIIIYTVLFMIVFILGMIFRPFILSALSNF